MTPAWASQASNGLYATFGLPYSVHHQFKWLPAQYFNPLGPSFNRSETLD